MIRKVATLVPALMLFTALAHGDVRISERHALKDALKTAGQSHSGRHRSPDATGGIVLTDAAGLQYFIDTAITFNTTSSASGAMSEASYTAAVAADTTGGGTSPSTLNDAFDGYGDICISTDGSSGPCLTDSGSYTIYNQNGTPTTDCSGRQVIFNPQTIGALTVSRKVYVPDTDEFARWTDIVTNTGGSAVPVTLITHNNLGSDSNTLISTTSDGNNTAEATDSWIASFQNFSGSTSSDPRLGHVIQNAGAPVPVSAINFVDGDDNPYWSYNFSLAPGATRIILTYVTGQPTRAAAAAKAAAIAAAPDATCLSQTEVGQVGNFVFVTAPNIIEVPTMSGLGLAALALLLCSAGFLVLRRRQA